MKYRVHDYAEALDQALAGATKTSQGAIAKNFLELVRRNGDEMRLKKILDEAGRLAQKRDGARQVIVESARPLTKSQEKIVGKLAKPGDALEHRINTALVAGVKVIVNDEMQFDGSMKAKLDSLFGAQI